MTRKSRYSKNKLAFAKRMKLNMTPPEALLWERLKNYRIGFEIFPQIVVQGYIADFFCGPLKLLIEVDSSFHDPVYDSKRDHNLGRYGYRTLRVQAKDIFSDIDKVVTRIKLEAYKP